MKRMSAKQLLAAAGLGCVLVFPARAATTVGLQKHDAGTYYVDGVLAGAGSVSFLVDTGASFMVIGEALLHKLKAAGTAEYRYDLHGVLADGSPTEVPVYQLAALRLGKQCWVHNVDAAIFRGNTRPILGINVLARMAPVTLSTQPPQLQVSQCQPERMPAAVVSDAEVTKQP